MASREVIGLVDGHLLVLFIGLFVLNDAVARAGLLRDLYGGLALFVRRIYRARSS
jgi:Na+/H+ antiporter NhaD/arsenite permease-like protein